MKIIKSKEFDLVTGQGLAPAPEHLEAGDIAVNYLAGHERIYMKNSEGEIVEFEPTAKAASSNGFNVVYELYNLPIDKRLIIAYISDTRADEVLSLRAMPPAGQELHIVVIKEDTSAIVVDTDNPEIPIITVDENAIIESGNSIIEINLISNGRMVVCRTAL